MNQELQNKLVEKYPEFFEYLKDHKGPLVPIVFGFECGDGWYVILDALMAEIKNHLENKNRNDKDSKVPHTLEILQIKEKYGGLCFYVGGADSETYGMIRLAESLSYKICELCGSTKDVGITQGWNITCCKKCFDGEKTNMKEWTPNND